ncbi:MAG: FecR family protein [Rhodospirillales bacterium]|nr:FecR family protein [Rhodospirillales bacterium]
MANDSEEAARWFAASRRGVMLHDERADYGRWRCDPANAARLSELQGVWQELGSADGLNVPEYRAPAAHRRQLASTVAFMSLTAVVLTRIDNVWLNSLDWWSR